ncbi:MAG: hypothetical protein VX699_10060 [Myxococcota bacterium]|nr:hypothetical protein [Myxococcota bacterium]
MRSRWCWWVLLITIAMATGCSGPKKPKKDLECEPGWLDVAGLCAQLCGADEDCVGYQMGCDQETGLCRQKRCDDSPGPCFAGVTCEENETGYVCGSCPAGYTGDGEACADVDECAGENRCHPLATCQNALGSYTCTCPPGYTDTAGDGSQCDDIDECATPGYCGANTVCTNTPGSVECACLPAFAEVNGECACPTVCLNEGQCMEGCCAVAASPEHGSSGDCGDVLSTGESCQPECDQGYTVSGPSVCTDGVLSAAVCSANACAPKTFDNSTEELTGTTGETGSVLCNDGYEGGQNWTCGSDGVFSGGSDCVACPADHYSTGGAACEPWNTCVAGEFATNTPDPILDRTCAPCESGEFSSVDNAPACDLWKDCSEGYRVSTEPGINNDRGCASCSGVDEYSDTINALACLICGEDLNSNAENTACVSDGNDSDGDGVLNSEDSCPTYPAPDFCGDPQIRAINKFDYASSFGSLTSGWTSNQPFDISVKAEEPVYSWGGMKDVGDVSWHKLQIGTEVASSAVLRDYAYYVKLKGGNSTNPTSFDLAVFTPVSNGGSAGGGLGCPGIGTLQDNVYGNAFLNVDEQDEQEVCERLDGAVWTSEGGNFSVDNFSFSDSEVNGGFGAGPCGGTEPLLCTHTGETNSYFGSSDTPWSTMTSVDPYDHPYPGEYSGADTESYIMIRVTKVSGSTCERYVLEADACGVSELQVGSAGYFCD